MFGNKRLKAEIVRLSYRVAELEERIPTRLEIIPGERGSVAKWHV